MWKINVTFMCIILSAISCSTKELDPSAYIEYVRDPNNGCLQDLSIHQVKYTIQYQPPEYLALLEFDPETDDSTAWSKLIANYSSFDQYLISIYSLNGENLLMKDISDEFERSERIKYYSFEVENDIYIASAADTLYPALAHFEGVAYGILPVINIVVAFQDKISDSDSDSYSITFFDRFIEKRVISWTFSKQKIQRIPGIVRL
jgi:hypothetical protein